MLKLENKTKGIFFKQISKRHNRDTVFSHRGKGDRRTFWNGAAGHVASSAVGFKQQRDLSKERGSAAQPAGATWRGRCLTPALGHCGPRADGSLSDEACRATGISVEYLGQVSWCFKTPIQRERPKLWYRCRAAMEY